MSKSTWPTAEAAAPNPTKTRLKPITNATPCEKTRQRLALMAPPSERVAMPPR